METKSKTRSSAVVEPKQASANQKAAAKKTKTEAKSSEIAKRKLSFTDLPAEVRCIIYRFLLHKAYLPFCEPVSDSLDSSILEVSKTIHPEASRIFYNLVTFGISNQDVRIALHSRHSIPRPFRPASVKLIENISLDVATGLAAIHPYAYRLASLKTIVLNAPAFSRALPPTHEDPEENEAARTAYVRKAVAEQKIKIRGYMASCALFAHCKVTIVIYFEVRPYTENTVTPLCDAVITTDSVSIIDKGYGLGAMLEKALAEALN